MALKLRISRLKSSGVHAGGLNHSYAPPPPPACFQRLLLYSLLAALRKVFCCSAIANTCSATRSQLYHTWIYLSTAFVRWQIDFAWVQDAYPDRGQSPERLKAVAEGKKQGKNLTVAPKAAGYVPPHLRGAVGQKKQAQVEGFDADEVSLPQLAVTAPSATF